MRKFRSILSSIFFIVSCMSFCLIVGISDFTYDGLIWVGILFAMFIGGYVLSVAIANPISVWKHIVSCAAIICTWWYKQTNNKSEDGLYLRKLLRRYGGYPNLYREFVNRCEIKYWAKHSTTEE